MIDRSLLTLVDHTPAFGSKVGVVESSHDMFSRPIPSHLIPLLSISTALKTTSPLIYTLPYPCLLLLPFPSKYPAMQTLPSTSTPAQDRVYHPRPTSKYFEG